MTVSGAGEGVEQPLKSADAAFGATDGFEILPPANFLSLQETARLQGTLERSLEKLASLWLDLKQASRARVASFGCASWHKANLEAAQRTMSQVARDEMACAKRTFGTFPHRFRL